MIQKRLAVPQGSCTQTPGGGGATVGAGAVLKGDFAAVAQGRQNVTLRAPEMEQKVEFTHHLARRSQRKWLDLLGRIPAQVCGVEIFKLRQRLATKIELAAPQRA